MADRSPDDVPTRPVPFDPDGPLDIPDASTLRLFNSPSFFRLWLGQVVSSELVATEIVRTLVGSIGLIAAVPITTALSALLVLDGTAGEK